jgi:hypothetical protein
MDWTFLRLPKEASDALPSRGMVSIEGTFNGVPFAATLQPDGEGGHWLRVEAELQRAARATTGDEVRLEIGPATAELEPEVPDDLQAALAIAPTDATKTWADITPAARRDYVAWILSAKKDETRAKRIAVAVDKLSRGERRPCCFDRSGIYGKGFRCPVPDDG